MEKKEKKTSEVPTTKEVELYVRVTEDVVTVKSMVIVTDEEEKYAIQVRFTLDDDAVLTHKPKITEDISSKVGGIPTTHREVKSVLVEEVVKDLKFLNKLLNENGEQRILCSYTIMNKKDKDNNLVSYKFMNDTDFKEFYPIDKDNKQIVE